MKVLVKGKEIDLTKNDYKGQGGEGVVYCQKGVGYKIYHDPRKMISVDKIKELQVISLPNVLAPTDVIYDVKGSAIGFTMRYLDKVEFLCKLFTKSFRDRNNITPEQIIELVKQMQKTLLEIHKKNILVVDYNEMNFLTDKDFKIPYHIDVDSYQTPSFPATALMESVRDRTTKKGKFTEGTDWFAWAIVTFQMYMGTHPYKGRHNNYKPKDWMQMMDDNISVFDKDVRLPANCQDWSMIPKPHFEWYKRVFKDKERSIPPFADAIVIVAAVTRMINSTDKFAVQLIEDYKNHIKAVYHFAGVNYVLTTANVFKGKNSVRNQLGGYLRTELCPVIGSEPVVALLNNKGEALFEGLDGTTIGKIAADDLMFANDAIYTVYNGKLIENSFVQFQKLIHQTKMVCNIFEPVHQLFRGVVVQDILGKCWMAIPTKVLCANVHIPELDGYRILDAKHDLGVCMVMAEKKGQYDRFVFCFNENYSKYTVRVENDVEIDSVNFVMKPMAIPLCIAVVNDLKVEAFFNNDKVKVIDNPPFDSSMKLFHDGKNVLFANKGKLYSVTLT